jgi:hypothetical protein
MRWCRREPTITEILSDSIVQAVMEADGIDPEALEAQLRCMTSLWVLTIAGAATLFVRGYTTTSADGRVAVTLSDAERDMVLGEMRGLLLAVAK